MAALFNYTGGREGTHAVTLCKPVGGGVIDIENVPIDQANMWITDKFYYQCGTTGDWSPTGYCIPHPADGPTPAGYDCDTPPQPAPPSVQAIAQAHTAAQPPITHLPAVGSFNDVLVAAALAIIVTVAITLGKRHVSKLVAWGEAEALGELPNNRN